MSSSGDLHVVVKRVQGCEEQLKEAPREVEVHNPMTGPHQRNNREVRDCSSWNVSTVLSEHSLQAER
jgi:hypothetical protein